jgi:S-formylglutathione hydrolase FrmB
MDRDIRACVVLPPEYAAHPEKSYPILYAFHGSDAPFDAFANMIPLRKALKDKPMILACIDGDGDSMYLDSPLLVKTNRAYGPQDPVKSLFTTFFLKEFIPAVDQRYRIDPKKRMLTGFSMGGFGAFHYMLAAPGEFVAVSTMSGYFPDWTQPVKEDWLSPLLGSYADNRQRYVDLDLRTRIQKQLAAGTKLPPIYMTCGTEDHLIDSSRDMHAFLNGLSVPNQLVEDHGAHTWPFWRDHSAQIIDFHWNAVQQK